MAIGEAYGVGTLGASLTGSALQQSGYSQISSYLNYQNTAGLGAFQIAYNPNYTTSTVTSTTNTTEVAAPQKSTPRWKHAVRAIDRLRGEISDWHGDILMRKAYA